jgi:hypothetical protein
MRANMLEYRLYRSDDLGRTWNLEAAIPTTKRAFTFYAPRDGTYWFQVAFVNKSNVQDPDEKTIMRSAAHQKMVIDTLKPIVRSFQAQRVGDDVMVTWDVQEDHPDLSRDGFRLEYQAKDSLTDSWKTVPVQAGLKGQTSFVPADKRTLMLRLTVRDLAGNQSYSQAEVVGTVATAGFQSDVGTLPIEMTLPKQTEKTPPMKQGKPEVVDPLPIDRVKVPPPVDQNQIKVPPPSDVVKMPPMVDTQKVPPPVPIEHKANKVAMDLKPLDTIAPPPGLTDKPVVAPSPPRLPPLQYISSHQIKLHYQLKRIGPSGVGSMEIWMTKNDGMSWEPYAKIQEKELARETVQGPQEGEFSFTDERGNPYPDGVYGLALVVKNKAGVGRTPRPGDVPEMRIEIDTTKPVVQMYQPIPDPEHPTQLLFRWNATDKNLTDTPVNLEYAENPTGPWLPIELNLKNTAHYVGPKVTGDYSWKVPAGTPVHVYLRVRVRDRAGNESIDAMETPQFVDLVEPEGALIGITPTSKK